MKNYLLFIFGLIIGVSISFYLPVIFNSCEYINVNPSKIKKIDGDYIYNIPTPSRKTLPTKEAAKTILRPRYYSTELGIRDKILIGILTTENNIHTRATAINKTVTHLVDKIKFFITANNVISDITLKNVVGFTDSREILKPFHVIKYIVDNFIDEYDYFYIATDVSYLDARRLVSLVEGISVSHDVYLGVPSDEDSLYCNLDAGILLSSSVLKQSRDKLEWCVHNAFSDSHSENLGRCIAHSTRLKCTDTIQGQYYTSYEIKTHKLDYQNLVKDKLFNKAITVYPVSQTSEIFVLHSYFTKLHLRSSTQNILKMRKDLVAASKKGPIDSPEPSWPIGSQPAKRPELRFDVNRWNYFNSTHLLLPDDSRNAALLQGADYADIHYILNSTVQYTMNKDRNLQYSQFIGGYRRFDSSRGMDYKLDILFQNTQNEQQELKRFEVFKQLGSVNILSTPYVTEMTRISLILPVFKNQVEDAKNFLVNYASSCMNKKDNTFLMLVLMYEYNSPSKGNNDIYIDLKRQSNTYTAKFKSNGSKIAWVSIRLPNVKVYDESYFKMSDIANQNIFEFNNTINGFSKRNKRHIGTMKKKNLAFHKEKMLQFAAVDLALRKIGLESLILICNMKMNLRSEFLNRVRMNTINGFQIFSPILFHLYDSKITHITTKEVHKDSGYFDSDYYDIISFYSRDYVNVRKLMENIYPIIRSDKDISLLFPDQYIPNNDFNINNKLNSIFELFVSYSLNIHCMRSIEPHLILDYENNCERRYKNNDLVVDHEFEECLLREGFSSKIAPKSALANLILEYNSLKSA